MNAPSDNRPPPPASATAQHNAPAPRPTSGRENKGLMAFFIAAAVLALLIVLGFNLLGPEGASRTGVGDGPAQSPAGPTTGGPSPGADRAQGTAPSGATTPTVESSAPQAADTPTAPGRESVGAPKGGALTSGSSAPEGLSGQGTGTGTGQAPATGAQPGASAMPAAPPASR